ncbi:MAG: hypothetical protein RRZ84_01710 [Romboutsia sp.]
MKNNRFRVLKKEIMSDWDKLNIAAKILVIAGALIFMTSIFIAFYDVPSNQITRDIEVIFRSSVASIFGFVLSSNLKNSKVSQKNIEKYEKALEHESCDKISEKYNYCDGNSIQLLIAFFICMVTIISTGSVYVFKIDIDPATISQLRDLMCTSIGFLLGESDIRK